MIDLRGKDEFDFFVPAEAARKSDGGESDSRRWIQGIASTDDVDLQNETVIQNGLDFSYFLKYGYINDDHKPGPEHKVGEPTEARHTKAGFWIKAFLYKGHGRADYWWELINALEQSGSSRKIGFSIQGKIQRRAGNSILKCWLQDVAITASPVNTHTWAEVVKSLSAERWCIHPWKSLEKACKGCPGNPACATSIPAMVAKEQEERDKALSAGGMGGRAMRVQSLEGRPSTLTFKSLPDRLTHAQAVEVLQKEKGYGPATAAAVADSIFAASATGGMR